MKGKEGSCSVHLLTNRESLDLNSISKEIFFLVPFAREIGSQPGPSHHLHLGLVSSVESRHIEWRYYLFLKHPTRENSVSLPAVSSGVAMSVCKPGGGNSKSVNGNSLLLLSF